MALESVIIVIHIYRYAIVHSSMHGTRPRLTCIEAPRLCVANPLHGHVGANLRTELSMQLELYSLDTECNAEILV